MAAVLANDIYEALSTNDVRFVCSAEVFPQSVPWLVI